MANNHQYTFGAPRTGNQALADYVQKPKENVGGNYRVTHYNDPVPRLPPAMMGFAHYTPEFYISAKNNASVSISQVVQLDAAAADKKGNEQFIVVDVQAHRWYFTMISACYEANTVDKNSKNTDTAPAPDLATSWAGDIIKLTGNSSGLVLVDSLAMTPAMMAALIAAGSVGGINGILTLMPGGDFIKPFVPNAGLTAGLTGAGINGISGLIGSYFGSGAKKSGSQPTPGVAKPTGA